MLGKFDLCATAWENPYRRDQYKLFSPADSVEMEPVLGITTTCSISLVNERRVPKWLA